jgi:hypothetical protein
MSSGSFFLPSSEAALRHVNLLAKMLKKVAIAGWISGAGCTALAVFVGRFFVIMNSPQTAVGVPGAREISGITLITWFMAIALLVFSSLYYVAGWGLAQQKSWARYTAAATFTLKVLLCVWLGRGSVAAMIVFLAVAGLDLYGLWVLLSKEAGLLFGAPQSSQAAIKPANLVT